VNGGGEGGGGAASVSQDKGPRLPCQLAVDTNVIMETGASHKSGSPFHGVVSHRLEQCHLLLFGVRSTAGQALPAAIRSSLALKHGDAVMENAAAALAGELLCLAVAECDACIAAIWFAIHPACSRGTIAQPVCLAQQRCL